MTEAQTEAALDRSLDRLAEALGMDPVKWREACAADEREREAIRAVAAKPISSMDRNLTLALIDHTAGLSSAEVKGFEEIESFAPYHEMPAFVSGFNNYMGGFRVRVSFGRLDAAGQAYDRGLMAASLCQRLGL